MKFFGFEVRPAHIGTFRTRVMTADARGSARERLSLVYLVDGNEVTTQVLLRSVVDEQSVTCCRVESASSRTINAHVARVLLELGGMLHRKQRKSDQKRCALL